MLPSYRPASSAMLSRAVLSSFRQQRNRQRRSKTSCTGGNLLLTLHLQPLSLLVTVGATLCPPPIPRYSSSLPPGSVMEPVAGRTPSPSRPPLNLVASASARGPEMATQRWRERLFGRWSEWCTHSPGGGPGGESFVSFCFCFVPKTSIKSGFLHLWVSR